MVCACPALPSLHVAHIGEYTGADDMFNIVSYVGGLGSYRLHTARTWLLEPTHRSIVVLDDFIRVA